MGKKKKDKGFGFISSLKKRKIPKRKGWQTLHEPIGRFVL